MYKIIVVDDEILSLKRFEHIIQSENRVQIVGSFSDSASALEYVKNNTIDIAFLDIEMPSPNGLELAEMILEADPLISIVFVTAFDQYALQAFQAHAIGYLLKPLDIEEFKAQINTIARTKAPRGTAVVQEKPKSVNMLKVKCLGQFTCYSDANETEPINFRTSKTMELFAFLIHHYDSPMSKYSIVDALFPDSDDDKANKLFYVSCSYLRSAFAKLNVSEILIRSNDTYRLNLDHIDCDYIKLMNASSNIQNLSTSELEALSAYCSGEYLMGKAYEWSFETKAYVDTLSQKILYLLAHAYKEAGAQLDAIRTYEKFLILDPCNDEVVEDLIRMYITGGQTEKAKLLFSSYTDKLLTFQGLNPPKSIIALVENL